MSGKSSDAAKTEPPYWCVFDILITRQIEKRDEVMPLIDLASSLTIAEVSSLKKTILDLFRSASGVTLDGSEIEQVDGAGIQLLAAVMKEAGERQIEIRWSGASQQLRSAATQLGLDELLGLAGNA